MKNIYYKDLTSQEKEAVNNAVRESMRKQKEDFIKDPRYKNVDPETVWYLKEDYINNWTFQDNYLFTKCDCGSFDFDCLSDTPSSYQSRKCVMKCAKCGETHIEYH